VLKNLIKTALLPDEKIESETVERKYQNGSLIGREL